VNVGIILNAAEIEAFGLKEAVWRSSRGVLAAGNFEVTARIA
jgi:hypothetical protein